jgi:hypothetical protein
MSEKFPELLLLPHPLVFDWSDFSVVIHQWTGNLLLFFDKTFIPNCPPGMYYDDMLLVEKALSYLIQKKWEFAT